MLRSARGPLLLAILTVLLLVGATWRRTREAQVRHAAPPPKALPVGSHAAATDWIWTEHEGSRTKVEVRAKSFRELADHSLIDLEGVELKLYDKEGKTFDQVRSARAQFHREQGRLYSEGEVEIVMGLPADDRSKAGRLVKIVSSGVTFESKTSKAYTDRAARFEFDQGEGKCVGASYDPTIRELIMRSEVELYWRGRTPKSEPMKLEAGELVYKEADSFVLLNQWSRLTRGNSTLESGNAIVNIRDGAIEKVEAENARGGDRQPRRNVEYAAPRLFMHFTPDSEVRRIEGLNGATLVSTSSDGQTTVSAGRIDLDFETASGESVLREALARDKASVESVPAAREGKARDETRILRGEYLALLMRPGGREIDRLETRSPGQLEFVPNHPSQRRRVLDASSITLHYGEENRIRTFRAAGAATRTEPERQDPKKPPEPPILTWSKELAAEFDPKTGRMAKLEQWDDFRYEQGDSKGRAERAVLEEARNQIRLEKSARVWDPTGAIAADRIVMDQKTGDVVAEGNVVSSRLPDRKGKSSAVLSNEQALEAQAARMETTERNRRIRYSGGAVVWQGPNRIRARTIDIDRSARTLAARTGVHSQFLDEPKENPAAAPAKAAAAKAAPAFIIVEAAALDYSESERLAHYTGGARLTRPGLEVRAAEIRAFLNESGKENTLDRASADGKVTLVRTQPDRTLTGTADHMEYYAADQKVVLTGGEPALVDSARGVARGRELTYFARDDKLLVNGLDNQPAVSRIRRK